MSNRTNEDRWAVVQGDCGSLSLRNLSRGSVTSNLRSDAWPVVMQFRASARNLEARKKTACHWAAVERCFASLVQAGLVR